MHLVQCPKCSKIYKCHGEITVKGLQYITDYGDNVTTHCLNCNQDMKPEVMETSDWIADLVFIVKGN